MRIHSHEPLAAREACHAVHCALASLPEFSAPTEVRVSDGLYFFYELGETSEHAPGGRVVRVGNHPHSDRGLVRRLLMHYTGDKNRSVFRKAVGGALLRRADPDDPCLAPRPGEGHWERPGAEPCGRCIRIEEEVTRLLCERFTFRVVPVSSRPLRNELERRLIATLAECPVCVPSEGWLGRFSYSDEMRRSGLWNKRSVGGPVLTDGQLRVFKELVMDGGSIVRGESTPPSFTPGGELSDSDSERADPSRTLVVIPCSAGKVRGSRYDGLGAGVVESLTVDLGQRFEAARRRVLPRAGADETQMAAWRRYGTGILYKTAGASLDRAVERWPHLLIMSGAYGIVTAREPIARYDRQLFLADWPAGLLEHVLVEYAAVHQIELVIGIAAKSGDYLALLRGIDWPPGVRRTFIQALPPSEAGRTLSALFDHGTIPPPLARAPSRTSEGSLDEPSKGGPRPSGFRIGQATLEEVRRAYEQYREEVESANIALNTKRTYLLHSENFVRWLEGGFRPGSRSG